MNLREYRDTLREAAQHHNDAVAKANEVLHMEVSRATAEFLGDHEARDMTEAEYEDAGIARRIHRG